MNRLDTTYDPDLLQDRKQREEELRSRIKNEIEDADPKSFLKVRVVSHDYSMILECYYVPGQEYAFISEYDHREFELKLEAGNCLEAFDIITRFGQIQDVDYE